MLAIVGFCMVALFMILIMTKRLSALTALILIPTAVALAMGYGLGVGDMMLEGVKALAPTGVLLIFAILFFGVIIDVGLFVPLVNFILKIVKDDPRRIVVGAAALSIGVSIDGDGATTYMICVAAMLPLFKRLRMDVRKLACVIILGNGVMNVVPWAGPTARVATVLQMDPRAIFVPLIPAVLATALFVLAVAYYLGDTEKRRLAALDENHKLIDIDEVEAVEDGVRRPHLMWVNFALLVAVMGSLIAGLLPTATIFMVGLAVALVINYPNLDQQRARLFAHGNNALSVGSLIFAAGIFTGILSGTKMVDAMAGSVVAFLPDGLGPYLAPITALLSIPFTFFMSNDAFYFGVLPILAEAAQHHGIAAADIGRASLAGQAVHLQSPLVASTYLLIALTNVDFGTHQRFTLKWALATSLVFMVASLLTGGYPFKA